MNIQYYLSLLKNKKVINSSAGGAVGSILKLEIADNCYFIIYCTWRLEQNEIVISTSTDSILPNTGLITKSVTLLDNKLIISVNLSKQNDLVLYFENNFCLRIFCDISYTNEYFDTNWELNIPDQNISFEIRNDFRIKRENYY